MVAGVAAFNGIVASGNADSAGAIQATALLLSNTVGMLALVLLLGHGLVAFPQHLWLQASFPDWLEQVQEKAAGIFEQHTEARMELSQVVSTVTKTQAHVAAVETDDTLLDAAQLLADECPSDIHRSRAGSVRFGRHEHVTLATLAALRYEVRLAASTFALLEHRLEATKLLAWELQDIIASWEREDGVQRIKWSFGKEQGSELEWYWHVKARPALYKTGACFAGLFSTLVLVGQVGLLADTPQASLFWLCVNGSANTSTAWATFFTFVVLAYVTAAAVPPPLLPLPPLLLLLRPRAAHSLTLSLISPLSGTWASSRRGRCSACGSRPPSTWRATSAPTRGRCRSPPGSAASSSPLWCTCTSGSCSRTTSPRGRGARTSLGWC